MAEKADYRDALNTSLQENILCLLCFSDSAAPIIAESVAEELFDNAIYREIAKQGISYYREYKKPIKIHLGDVLEHKLDVKEKSHKAYEQVLTLLFETKDQINEKFVLNELYKFIEQQTLKAGITEAALSLRNGDLESAKSVISKAISKQAVSFDPGFTLDDTDRVFKFYDDAIIPFPLGLKPMDDLRFGPGRGELTVILGPANRGKTFFLMHIGKHNSIRGLRVLHISLEMSEEKMSQRYVQTFMSLPKHKAEVTYRNFVRDDLGRFSSFEETSVIRPTLFTFEETGEVTKNEVEIRNHYEKIKYRMAGIWLKRFPTNSLTISGLESYLDYLHQAHNWAPDMVLLDYADLMLLDQRNLRVSTGNVYKDLRRIAIEHNLAMVTASQSNRLGEDARLLTLKYLGEDYSKAATADNIIAYCQTDFEHKFQLARLFVAKARDEERGLTYIISQSYQMAQFCTDIFPLQDRYWTELGHLANDNDQYTDQEEVVDRPTQTRQRRRQLPVRR